MAILPDGPLNALYRALDTSTATGPWLIAIEVTPLRWPEIIIEISEDRAFIGPFHALNVGIQIRNRASSRSSNQNPI